VPAPAVLATLRARATLVDRMLDAELDDARDAGEMISLWTFGGGFDARWHRLAATLRDAVVEQVEVELPEVIAAKDALLARSPFAKAWASIRRRALPAEQWRVPAGEAGPGVRRLLLL
jgi:O-methyltransferase involved in polyketide biosynthesis